MHIKLKWIIFVQMEKMILKKYFVRNVSKNIWSLFYGGCKSQTAQNIFKIPALGDF